VLLLERNEAVGGAIRTEARDGFVVDLGPQTVRGKDPALFEHFAELGIEGARTVAGSGAGKRFVLLDGRMVALPGGPKDLLGTPLLSPAGKLRLLAEPFVRRGQGPDESVDAFFRRRLGPEVAERIVDPFVSGIYAGNPSELSMAGVFPSLLKGEREKGSLLRWGLARALDAWRTRKLRKGEAKAVSGEATRPREAQIFSFRGGLGRWPEALARRLGSSLRTGVEVREMTRSPEGWSVAWQGGSARTRHLVLAVPAEIAAALLRPVADGDASRLGGVPTAAVATVSLGYRTEDLPAPDGFGVLIPSREERPVLGILWISSLFEGRCPEGTVLTTSFVGGARHPERVGMDNGELVAQAHREHVSILGARGKPIFRRVARWSRAIPQLTLADRDRIRAADRIERDRPRIHLIGSYRAEGPSVPACWRRGRDAGARILARVEGNRERARARTEERGAR